LGLFCVIVYLGMCAFVGPEWSGAVSKWVSV